GRRAGAVRPVAHRPRVLACAGGRGQPAARPRSLVLSRAGQRQGPLRLRRRRRAVGRRAAPVHGDPTRDLDPERLRPARQGECRMKPATSTIEAAATATATASVGAQPVSGAYRTYVLVALAIVGFMCSVDKVVISMF